MRQRVVVSGASIEIKPLKALQPTSSNPSAIFAMD
jgi:hypothetical protein